MAVPTSSSNLPHLLLSLVQSLIFITLCVTIPPAIQPLNIRPIPLLNITIEDGVTIRVKDLALMNPYLPDNEVTVSGLMLAVISFVLPVSTFVLVWFCCSRRRSIDSKGEDDPLMNLEEGDGSKVGRKRLDGRTDFLLILTAYFYAMGGESDDERLVGLVSVAPTPTTLSNSYHINANPRFVCLPRSHAPHH